MFNEEANIREAIAKKKARIEQLERILAVPTCDLSSRYGLRLIEEKQHHELALAELERALSRVFGLPEAVENSDSDVDDRAAFCLEVVNEIRKVKNRHKHGGYSVAQIHKKNPSWNVWKVVEGLSEDDQELFHHPNRWGSVVGYAENVVGKYYERSSSTIHDWLKKARRQRKLVR